LHLNNIFVALRRLVLPGWLEASDPTHSPWGLSKGRTKAAPWLRRAQPERMGGL